MKLPEKLQEIRAATEKLSNEYKQLKADGPQDKALEDMMFRMINHVHARISYLEEGFYDFMYKHTSNHVPNLSAGQMEKFLKNVGAENDYQVIKPAIFVSKASRHGAVIEAE
ncbi:MAG: hypothetical protein Q8O88_03450, partial [bacterium]|nr:hypothetical protein [bacterium]